MRFHMAQWFDAHEQTGHYLTDADVTVFRLHCDASPIPWHFFFVPMILIQPIIADRLNKDTILAATFLEYPVVCNVLGAL